MERESIRGRRGCIGVAGLGREEVGVCCRWVHAAAGGHSCCLLISYPLHLCCCFRQRVHPRQDHQGHRDLDQDEAHAHHPQGLPPLDRQVQAVSLRHIEQAEANSPTHRKNRTLLLHRHIDISLILKIDACSSHGRCQPRQWMGVMRRECWLELMIRQCYSTVSAEPSTPLPSPPFSRCYDVCSFEKRHRNLAAHLSPAFPNVKEGDIVTVGQVRKSSLLPRTVRDVCSGRSGGAKQLVLSGSHTALSRRSGG